MSDDSSPTAAARVRRTLIFANDKSSGKTTAVNAVIVSLLRAHPAVMRNVEVREYERGPRLAAVFGPEDGIGRVVHRDARNAAAFDSARELAFDPNATPWDDLLYDIGVGNLIVDLGSNMFTEICRILDDEPRPIFPEESGRVGVVVPVTSAGDSIESAAAAIDHALGWGARSRVFILEQEYLGRLQDGPADWVAYRDRLLAAEPERVRLARIERLMAANIGGVVFRRIDRIVADAQEALRSPTLKGAALLRTLRQARAEITWGGRALEAVRPIADWFAG